MHFKLKHLISASLGIRFLLYNPRFVTQLCALAAKNLRRSKGGLLSWQPVSSEPRLGGHTAASFAAYLIVTLLIGAFFPAPDALKSLLKYCVLFSKHREGRAPEVSSAFSFMYPFR